MNVPATSIFLRDRFQLRPDTERTFLKAAEQLVKFAPDEWCLVAAGSIGRRYHFENPSWSAPPMMHIWQLQSWDTLYTSMFRTSELGWYMDLEEAMDRESQNFYVDYRVGLGTTRRPEWKAAEEPGFVYRYETLRLGRDTNSFDFLVTLTALAATVREHGWSWHWSAASVTGKQRGLGLLSSAPGEQTFERVLARPDVRALYGALHGFAKRGREELLHPIVTERYASTGVHEEAAE